MVMRGNNLRCAIGGRRGIFLVVLLIGVLTLVDFGCREDFAPEYDRNRPPDTYLTGAPPESMTAFYRVHLYWYGDDDDGNVVGFEYAITDSLPGDEDTIAYRYTTRTDSMIIFPVSAGQQVLGHRFYVRAIDNEGAVDPEPAWTFFSGIDLVPPTPRLIRAEAFDPISGATQPLRYSSEPVPKDTVTAGWHVRFAWEGLDRDSMINLAGELVHVGKILQYEYWLAPLDIAPRLGGIQDTAITYAGMTSGKYRFSLRGVDDAGFMGLNPVLRTFVWNRDPQTYFRRMWNDTAGDSTPYVIATSNAWQGERVYFPGDTIPLRGGVTGQPEPITIKTRVWGKDPDGTEGVSDFEYLLGSGVFSPVTDPTRREIAITGLRTSYKTLFARCYDEHQRRDGSPAVLPININQKPRLLDTLDLAREILQYPRPNGVVPLDSILAWGESLYVAVRAWDPDATTDKFHYSFRFGGQGYLFSNRNVVPIDGIRSLKLPFAAEAGRDVALDVRVEEDGAGAVKGSDAPIRTIRFHVVDD